MAAKIAAVGFFAIVGAAKNMPSITFHMNRIRFRAGISRKTSKGVYPLKWSSFLSQSSSFEDAVREACQAVTASLYGVSSGVGGESAVDLAVVFVSESWQSEY